MESIFTTIFPMFVVFGIFYFIIIRPQNKKRDEFQNMLNNMKKGDKVVTAGGLRGNIKGFQGENNEIIILDLGEANVNVMKNYIVDIIKK
ncbi:MAG: preprotein translocase subunit YajC [Candidatus Marinimicrobia bacterium]|nr:preprotein translocase subunit YajC [Candidatus Neomarinimicrobiota bacterium]|tara:strand:- start:415 stop:684 length:270 start_codon:yes stop_codon:yes gene_type:complete